MTAVEFAAAARTLGDAARSAGLVVPAFRAPPKTGANRTLRRLPDAVVVSVRLDRPAGEVVSDMVDGIILANQLSGEREHDTRTLLIAAL